MGRTNDDALHAAQAHSELNDWGEAPPLVPAQVAGRSEQAEALWIDQYEMASAARQSARLRPQGIRIDRLDRMSVASDSVSERLVRAAIVLALLIVTITALVWVGGSNWIRVPPPAPAPVRASLPDPTPTQSDPVAASVKGDRLPVSIADLAARESAKPLPKEPDITSLFTPPPAKSAPPARQPQTETRIVSPVPETRPATIPGWTVREVVGDLAVIEGPHGTRRVSRGESLPGLGRVETIVRWGNRWIVTTERGLISTN
jgi:hypothetical protein